MFSDEFDGVSCDNLYTELCWNDRKDLDRASLKLAGFKVDTISQYGDGLCESIVLVDLEIEHAGVTASVWRLNEADLKAARWAWPN